MRPTDTGDGLNLVIRCKSTVEHGWMAFASWYAARACLPDARIAIVSGRGPTSLYFRWCRKVGVPFFRSNVLPTPVPNVLEIAPSVMAVRSYDPDRIGPSPASSDDYVTFVDYSRCGGFVLADWIDKWTGPPFAGASRRFGPGNPNETKVFSMWERCQTLYSAM